jgi:uncharacterized protein
VDFEWDETKNARNIRDHGIDFDDAIGIFDGPTVTDYDAREDYGEDRWVAFGVVEGRVLAVVYTGLGRRPPHHFGTKGDSE